MKFECGNCGQRIEASEDQAGTLAQCPTCKHDILVPGAVVRRLLALGVWWWIGGAVGVGLVVVLLLQGFRYGKDPDVPLANSSPALQYHPKVRALLDLLHVMDKQCSNIIERYPNGKPLEPDALLEVFLADMFHTQTGISDAITALQEDATLSIDPALSEAIHDYETNPSGVYASERLLQEKVRKLSEAIESAGKRAVTLK